MTQPEALRLADRLTMHDYYEFDAALHCPSAAAELRRLHESNKDLLEALKDMGARYGLTDLAREAIAKAEGGTS
jgi:hypothetical protein